MQRNELKRGDKIKKIEAKYSKKHLEDLYFGVGYEERLKHPKVEEIKEPFEFINQGNGYVVVREKVD